MSDWKRKPLLLIRVQRLQESDLHDVTAHLASSSMVARNVETDAPPPYDSVVLTRPNPGAAAAITSNPRARADIDIVVSDPVKQGDPLQVCLLLSLARRVGRDRLPWGSRPSHENRRHT